MILSRVRFDRGRRSFRGFLKIPMLHLSDRATPCLPVDIFASTFPLPSGRHTLFLAQLYLDVVVSQWSSPLRTLLRHIGAGFLFPPSFFSVQSPNLSSLSTSITFLNSGGLPQWPKQGQAQAGSHIRDLLFQVSLAPSRLRPTQKGRFHFPPPSTLRVCCPSCEGSFFPWVCGVFFSEPVFASHSGGGGGVLGLGETHFSPPPPLPPPLSCPVDIARFLFPPPGVPIASRDALLPLGQSPSPVQISFADPRSHPPISFFPPFHKNFLIWEKPQSGNLTFDRSGHPQVPS